MQLGAHIDFEISIPFIYITASRIVFKDQSILIQYVSGWILGNSYLINGR